METKLFEPKKITAFLKFSGDVVSSLNYNLGFDGDDFALNQLTAKLDAIVYQSTFDEKRVSYQFKPPTFLEWILRKPRTVQIDIKVSELLKNPPECSDTIKIYYADVASTNP